jgi:hypothetical protein
MFSTGKYSPCAPAVTTVCPLPLLAEHTHGTHNNSVGFVFTLKTPHYRKDILDNPRRNVRKAVAMELSGRA